MKIDDVPPYTEILGRLAKLRDVAGAARCKAGEGGRSSSAQMLHSVLDGMFDRMEAHAIARGVGIARMIFTEISGHAGLRVFQRLDAACLQQRRVASRVPPAANDAGRSPNGGGPRGGPAVRLGVLSAVKCFDCGEAGHIRPHCPNKGKSKPT